MAFILPLCVSYIFYFFKSIIFVLYACPWIVQKQELCKNAHYIMTVSISIFTVVIRNRHRTIVGIKT